jgi:hypothetical protein
MFKGFHAKIIQYLPNLCINIPYLEKQEPGEKIGLQVSGVSLWLCMIL